MKSCLRHCIAKKDRSSAKERYMPIYTDSCRYIVSICSPRGTIDAVLVATALLDLFIFQSQGRIPSVEGTPATEVKGTPEFTFPQIGHTSTVNLKAFLSRVQTDEWRTSRNGVNTVALQSLERRFMSQQVLETPLSGSTVCSLPGLDFDTPKNFDDQSDSEDFKIFSQPNYERAQSQKIDDVGDDEDDVDYCNSDNDFPAGQGAKGAEPLRESECVDNCEMKKSFAKVEAATKQGKSSIRSCEHHCNSIVAVEQVENKTGGVTPAMALEDSCLTDTESLPNNKLFCVFLPKEARKKLYIIRHGESEYNEAISRRGTSFSDPLIFDARLTSKGRRQAASLRAQVASWNLPEDTVWITSPLSRAIETLLLARPTSCQDSNFLLDENSPSNGESSSSSSLGSQDCPWDDVFVLSTISERVMTSGDIGRKPGDLVRCFPQFAKQFSSLPEVWWWCHPDDPGCAYQRRVGKSEPKKSVQARVVEFKRWIQNRPEKVFVAVGHSLFWKELITNIKQTKYESLIPNCGFKVLNI